MAKLKTAKNPSKFKTIDEFDGGDSAALESRGQVAARSAADFGTSQLDELDAPDLDRADQIPSQEQFEGIFDAINEGVVEGWAYSKVNPTSRVRVEIWAGDRFVAFGLADRFRGDLASAHISDGSCAFKIPVPDDLERDVVYPLSVRIAGTDVFLPGSPIAYSVPQNAAKGVISAIEGSAVRCEILCRSEDPVDVALFIDGASAGHHRIAGGEAGRRQGFMIQLPLGVLDGRVAWLSLIDARSGERIADAALQLPVVATPEDALRRYARSFPAFMSSVGALRHASLRLRFALAGQTGTALSAEACRQIERAYDAVLMGFTSTDAPRLPLAFPDVAAPVVSVVIPVHNKFEVTYNCLASLLLAPNRASFEVIIVDDGSSDRTVDLAALVSGLTVLRNDVSIGFVRSCNRGAAAMRGEYLVLLNNDTEVCAAWLDELLSVFAANPAAGLVGSKLLYPNGRLQEAGGIIFRDQCWNYGRDGNPHDPRYNYTREADYISGAAIMLPRAIWRELEGFAEVFAPAYYEDADLAMRVRQSGRKVFYAPFSQVIHFEGQSNGVSTSHGIKRYQIVNEKTFRSRWANELVRRPMAPDVGAALNLTSLFRVLAIDSSVPQPDRSAGSYAAVQEIRLLQSLGAQVTFIPENLAYLGNYTEDLQRSGVECLYAPFCTSILDFIAERGHEFDVIYITRYQVAARYIAAIRAAAPKAKVVFCNADLHFLREIRAAIVDDSPEAMNAALDTRDAELALVRKVDVTLSYSDAEAAVILSHNLGSSRVMRCPWVVETKGSQAAFADRRDIAFLGGFGHPPNRDAVEFFITAVMPRLREILPGMRFRIYGAEMPDSLKKRATDDIVLDGYVADVAEVYDTCRVFVAPLRSGAGIKGKVIGALAAGLPTVLSPVAAEGTGVAHDREAIVAETVQEWVDGICALYSDEARWAAMSENATRFARSQYSFAAGRRRMASALASVDVYTSETV